MSDQKEARFICRLAWNNWPDNEISRRQIEASEARDPVSAAAWDRVINALVPVDRAQATEDLLTDICFHLSETTDPALRKLFEQARRLLDPVGGSRNAG